jgi:hypothetical protein
MSATLTYIRINLTRVLLVVTAVSALATWYLSSPQVDTVFNEINIWNINITTFTLFSGLITICIRYVRGVTQRSANTWPFQAYALILIFVWIIMGQIFGMYSDTYQTVFLSTKITLHIAILGQIIYFYTSGAYRTFRIKSLRTAALALSAVLIIAANAPWLQNPFPAIGDMAYWLLNNPQTGGYRAIVITGAIGAVVLGLRVLLGLEKGAMRVTEGD